MDEAAFLARLRHPPERTRASHPGSYVPPVASAPSWERFCTVLEGVGGSHHQPVARAQLGAAVSAVMEFGAHGRCVATAGAAALLGPVPRLEVADPQAPGASFQDVDLAVVLAEAGSCEDAALLLSSASLPERALLFLAQHVLALVDLATLAPHLHAAAQAVQQAQPQRPHHWTWVSGPSKTADIEQTLVIGAHGCRSLLVLPFGTPPGASA